MKSIKKKWQSQAGQTMVLFGVTLLAIIGFTALSVDVGYAAFQKSTLQSAADAAVLAGAHSLPDKNKAELDAKTYADKNGEAGDIVSVAVTDDNHTIKVSIERKVPMFFAKVIQINSMDVKVDATAKLGIAASVPWIVPFVIPEPAAFNYDHKYVMRMYGGGPYPYGYSYPSDYRNHSFYKSYPISKPYTYQFDYMNVKVTAGSNPSVEFQSYLSYLKDGYKETYTLNQDMLYYAPSSGGRQSVDTFATRISSDPNTDYTKAKVGDPRVMLIPVVKNLMPRNTSENTKVKIIGFVGFYLESIHKNSYGETFWFEGRFLKDLNVGTGQVTYDANADFGLRCIKLTN